MRKENVMSKTLSNIITVFKVVRIVAKVIFILCVIGFAGCILAAVMLPFAISILPLDILADKEIALAYPGCISGAIACAGEAVIAFLAERYCGNVLKANTPFTLEGSKECFRLGIASIIASVAVSVASGIAFAIFTVVTQSSPDASFDASVSLTAGLLLLFLSLVFKYGAEVQSAAAKSEAKNSESSDTYTV